MVDARAPFLRQADKDGEPIREPLHHRAEAQLQPERLHQDHPCSRKRIHTITDDRQWTVPVTPLCGEALVPSIYLSD